MALLQDNSDLCMLFSPLGLALLLTHPLSLCMCVLGERPMQIVNLLSLQILISQCTSFSLPCFSPLAQILNLHYSEEEEGGNDDLWHAGTLTEFLWGFQFSCKSTKHLKPKQSFPLFGSFVSVYFCACSVVAAVRIQVQYKENFWPDLCYFQGWLQFLHGWHKHGFLLLATTFLAAAKRSAQNSLVNSSVNR